jgi:hypothetical protein
MNSYSNQNSLWTSIGSNLKYEEICFLILDAFRYGFKHRNERSQPIVAFLIERAKNIDLEVLIQIANEIETKLESKAEFSLEALEEWMVALKVIKLRLEK